MGLGDQVAVIPSLTGDGMAIALHSGTIGAESWLAGGTAATYQKALGFTLNRQMRLAHILHRACLSGWLQSAIVRSTALFPGAIAQAGTLTRLPDEARVTRR